MEDFLAIAKVVNTHGVKGEVKLMPLTSDISRFDDLEHVFVNINNNIKKLEVEAVRYFKGFVLLKIKGIDSIDEAEGLKNLDLIVDRKNARKLDEDEFFICDLIGCNVFENDILLGEIVNILQTGSNDVYEVKNDKTKNILIPALKTVVKKIDINSKRIDVLLPEGLIDDEVWHFNYFPWNIKNLL